MRVGLLGRGLSHSLSPYLHSFFGNYDYELCETEPEDIEAIIRSGRFSGFNVTMPYKKEVMKYCDRISDGAVQCGCVNTLTVADNGCVIGYNTDRSGFAYLLKRSKIELKEKQVLILGDGATAMTIRSVAILLGAATVTLLPGALVRKGVTADFGGGSYEIIINATPSGMYPSISGSPVDLKCFDNCQAYIDVIYNPLRTASLLQAETLGIQAVNGLSMLCAQAKYSAELFMHERVSCSLESVIRTIGVNQVNIVLCGTGGSGKTVIALELSKLTGRPLFDSDELIAGLTGLSSSAFIKASGEEAFRRIESDVVRRLALKTGCIISCGGGTLLNEVNNRLLSANSLRVYIQRECLDISNRPIYERELNKPDGLNALEKLLRKRDSFYIANSDFIVKNDSTPPVAAAEILSRLKQEQWF